MGGSGRAGRVRPGVVPAEVPLREIHDSAVDLGDGFGMPTTQTPDQMLENAIARMLRGVPGMRLRSIAMRPDCRLDVAGLWGVLRINRYTQMYGTARLTDMADYLRIPFEVLEPTFAAWCARVTRSATATRCG